MGQPTNTFSTYDQVGRREDLSDIIYDVSPLETPLLSGLERVTATSTKHEWQTHALTAASASNFVIEGDDATTDAGTATSRIFNYMAISDKVAIVTGTTEAVKAAGRRSEMAFQMANRMKELKRDIESILFANNAYVAGTDTLARESAGLQAYIATNISKDSGSTAPTGDGSDAFTASGTTRALLESYAETVLSSIWDNHASGSLTAFCGKFQKRKIATWSGSSSKTQDGGKTKVVNSVDIYVDPLGSDVKVVPNRFCPTDALFFVDMEYVKLAVLRDFFTTELAKTGDSTRKQIIFEGGLEVCNQKAHGIVADLTTS